MRVKRQELYSVYVYLVTDRFLVKALSRHLQPGRKILLEQTLCLAFGYNQTLYLIFVA